MSEQNKPQPNQRSGYNPIAPVEVPMSAQQLQAFQKDMAARLAAITKDVDLRKWAVDQACGLSGAAFEAKVDLRGQPGVDVVKTAREIHKFLTEGAIEVK